MGSWTGKYDPIRRIGDATKKITGVDLSPLNRIHTAISNKAHSIADTYLNQQPEGSENRKANRRSAVQQYAYSRGSQAEYDTPANMRKAMRKRNLTIMGGA